MKTASATMRDIARELGITITTVSRALNNKPDVAPDTRQRVLEVAERVGYVPSALGQGLAAGHVDAIGCIVTSIADPFVAGILEGIESAAQAARLSVLIATSHGRPSEELAAANRLRSFHVAGVISTSSILRATHREQLRHLGSPIILINNEADEFVAGSIRIDNQAIAHSAIDHLTGLGHHRIAHITCDDGSTSSTARARGYRAALEHRGTPFDPALVAAAKDCPQAGAEAARRLMEQADRPTAIFCYNDRIAIGALAGLQQAGFQVPQDVSVVGVDDIEMAAWVTPTLTTVRQPAEAIGQRAVEALLQLRERVGEPVDIIVPPTLIERNSTTRR